MRLVGTVITKEFVSGFANARAQVISESMWVFFSTIRVDYRGESHPQESVERKQKKERESESERKANFSPLRSRDKSADPFRVCFAKSNINNYYY